MNFEVVARGPSPEVVEGLLAGLPEWFGIPEAAQEYVAEAQSLPALVAINDAGQPVGVLVHRRHFPESIEIHVMAVARGCHRQGVGRALVDALVAHAAAEGVRLMSVKTLGPSHPDAGYANTRRFYRACGFCCRGASRAVGRMQPVFGDGQAAQLTTVLVANQAPSGGGRGDESASPLSAELGR